MGVYQSVILKERKDEQQLKDLLKPVKSYIKNFSILHVLNVRLVLNVQATLATPVCTGTAMPILCISLNFDF